jgi:NNP family nitrate/nitrite transporter-like MFS transporter
MIGFASGSLLAGLVLLQPVFSVLIMAPGFTVLALSFPPQLRSVTIALMGPINAMVGVGLVPTFLGYLGDAGHFDIGFIVMGIILLFSMIFLPFFPRGNASQQN